MYLKFTIAGPLEDIVRSAWPDASDSDLFSDYENVYEWVWLTLPEDGLRLNISREHEWGDEDEGGHVFPIYVAPFEIDKEKFLDALPAEIAERIAKAHQCVVEAFAGRSNVDKEDGLPFKVYE